MTPCNGWFGSYFPSKRDCLWLMLQSFNKPLISMYLTTNKPWICPIIIWGVTFLAFESPWQYPLLTPSGTKLQHVRSWMRSYSSSEVGMSPPKTHTWAEGWNASSKKWESCYSTTHLRKLIGRQVPELDVTTWRSLLPRNLLTIGKGGTSEVVHVLRDSAKCLA